MEVSCGQYFSFGGASYFGVFCHIFGDGSKGVKWSGHGSMKESAVRSNLFLQLYLMLGNQLPDNLFKLGTVLDIGQWNATVPGHQSPESQIDHILIVDDPARQKIPFNGNGLPEADFPENNHWHAQYREAKDEGIDNIRKDRAGNECHENKENTGEHSDWIKNNRQADAHGVFWFKNGLFAEIFV
jgi:hypothetical protein